jgi:hypothetical protein
MDRFISQHRSSIIGTLSGFDRLIFRGTVRGLAYPEAMMGYLWQRQVLLKDFGAFAETTTAAVKEASLAEAQALGRPIIYLEKSNTGKEPIASKILTRDGVRDGLVCVLKCVEPCSTFDIFKNRETKRLELVNRFRKCLHIYHYRVDPVFGFVGIRLQTWFPFHVQVWINGREWLARQLDAARIPYKRLDNSFAWIADFPRAQALMSRQLKAQWPRLLGRLASLVNPLHDKLFRPLGLDYYWSVHQSEWAIDITFRDAKSLAAIYPGLVLHAMTRLGSGDVMRFLGNKVHGSFLGQIVTDFKNRPEGVRIKHRVGANSLKLYDKFGINLRVEATFHDASALKVFRPKEGEPDGPLAWRPLRKGIADIHRRAELSQAADERYLDALADADTSTPLGTLIQASCHRTTWNGRRFRALHPMDEDFLLIDAVADGAHCIQGLRNKDIRLLLYGPDPTDKHERRRRSARVSRLLRLLRAHGLIQKVSRSHRYNVTSKGRSLFAATIAANRVTLAQLGAVA